MPPSSSDRVVGEWVAIGRRLPAAEPDALTVSEVAPAFWRHAQRYYGNRGGKVVGELSSYSNALRPLRKLYGAAAAAGFGSVALEAVRDRMLRAGVARTSINRRGRADPPRVQVGGVKAARARRRAPGVEDGSTA